jgi:hypothetical protein
VVGVTREGYFDDPEFARVFNDLVQGLAEHTRQEHEELINHGFRTVEVVGSPMILYERNGTTYTKEYALAAIHAIKEAGSD